MQTSLLSSGKEKNEYYMDVELVFTTFPAFLLTNIWYRWCAICHEKQIDFEGKKPQRGGADSGLFVDG